MNKILEQKNEWKKHKMECVEETRDSSSSDIDDSEEFDGFLDWRKKKVLK